MFFLLRTAFWLSVVIILLPTGPSKPGTESSQVGATEAVSFATAALSDMRQFCARQPDACVVGSQAMVAFGHKAQASAKMLYEFITDRRDSEETGSVTDTASKSVPAATRSPSQSTLTPSDRQPAWRGPQLGKAPQTKRPV